MNKYTITVKHKTLGSFISKELELDKQQLEIVKDTIRTETGNIYIENYRGETIIFRAAILNESIITISPIGKDE